VIDGMRLRRVYIPLELENYLVERCAARVPTGLGWSVSTARRVVWALADLFQLKHRDNDDAREFSNMLYVPSPPVDKVWALYGANGVRARRKIRLRGAKRVFNTARDGPPGGIDLCEDPRYYRTCVVLGMLRLAPFALDPVAWPDQPTGGDVPVNFTLPAGYVPAHFALHAGDTVLLRVDLSWRVSFFRILVEIELDTVLSRQLLVHGDLEMQDDRTLGDYGITANSAITLYTATTH
jgi:hypothetical protein